MNLRIAAALVLSPLMLHAQANSPAQPQAANAPESHASLAMPTLMLSSASASAADATTVRPAKLRVSTGVTGPKRIVTVPVDVEAISAKELAGHNLEAVLSMTVNEAVRDMANMLSRPIMCGPPIR